MVARYLWIALALGVSPACSEVNRAEGTPITQTAGNQPAPAPQPAPEQRGRTMIEAKPLSLSELVKRAEQILLGTVKDVQQKSVELSDQGRTTNAQVRDVTIAVTEGIKNVKTGDTVVIRQLVAVSSPLNVGEEVMWFLAPASRLGLTQPLGVFSGDFRIEATPTGARVVQNLRGNEGLWDQSVWDEGFSRAAVLSQAKERKMPSARIQALEAAAAKDPAEREVPLDLLLLLTRSVVKQ